MNAQEAIQTLVTRPTNDEALQILEADVAAASRTGHGAQDDNLINWLADGEYTGSETVASLAAEWDADRE